MTTRRPARRLQRDERGGSLIIALAFLALFSLWLSATLTATESGMNITQSQKIEPKRLYAADAALERTIQEMRYDASAGSWDDTCDQYGGEGDPGVEYQDNPKVKIWVRCEPDGNSGRGDEGESSPPVGLISLSNGVLDEFGYQQYGNSIVRIDGGASSTTPIFFQNGNDCQQQQNCQQLNLCPRNVKTITDGVLQRNYGTASTPNVFVGPWVFDDIGVPITGAGIPANTTISLVGSPGLVTMSRNATQSGSNRTIRFREDYPKLQRHCRPPTDPAEQKKGRLTSAPRVVGTDAESCDQARVVALQFNCDGAYPLSGGLAEPDPGYPVDNFSGFGRKDVPSCDSAPRVIELEPGRYESAAALTALTTQCDKIIWFRPGPKNVENPGPRDGSYYFDFPPGDDVWRIGGTNKPNLAVVAGQKTWDREPFNACVDYSNSTKLSTVHASGNVFKPTDANNAYINAGYNLPYKALIKSVTAGGSKATFAGPPLTNNFGCSKVDDPNPTSNYTVSPGLSNLGSMCNPVTNTDHPGVQFIFGGTSRVVLEENKTEICSPVEGNRQQVAIFGVTDKEAKGQLRVQSGCIVAQPYTPGGGAGCPMISAKAGAKPAILVHGTLYAPKAVVDLSLQGVSYQIVSRGIIARVIALSVSPSAQFTDPVVYSPNFGSVPGSPRKVTLTACTDGICPPDGPGKPKIRTIVRIQDADERNNPGVPGHRVFIDSWSVL